MIEESKILEMLKSYTQGQDMRLEALAISQAREEQHIKNIDEKLTGVCKVIEDKLDERYAPKYIEKLVWVIGTAVVLWVVNTILGLIPKAHAIFPNLL